MGIKLGSIIEVVDSAEPDSIPVDTYDIVDLDPRDLRVPFLGQGRTSGERVWFNPRGEVFDFENRTDVIVVKE